MSEVYAVAAVGCGAAVGGVLRLLVTQVVVARLGPGFGHYATFLINVTGSFSIGAVYELSRSHGGFDPVLAAFLTTGLIGGYTTFSTFTYEALNLSFQRLGAAALLYTVGSVLCGVVGAFLGVAATRAAGA
ncbi:MAG: fluoride exporter [Candidatus Eremiobacteraeota bacterium]|nr:fluoride exporter [Candidatus Eremiobacteraeota bacterium]